MSRRKFSFKSEDRIAELQQIHLKKKTEAKVNWAVNAYNDWRNERLVNFIYNVGIYFADLNKVNELTKENLQHALCRFIPEVTKVKGEGPYPGKTLYQMIVAIQKYLQVNKLNWRLVDGPEFIDLHTVLDNVMQEHTAMNVGVVKRQAEVISYETEKDLWDRGFLGEDTPDKLRNTVLFMLGVNVYLRAIEEHYYLHRPSPDEASQISFEHDSQNVKCLVYREDTVTKTHDGGLNDMKRDRKIVWVYPSEDSTHCPVRLVEKYMNLCPKYYGKKNFYLQSLSKTRPSQWYGNQVIGQNSLSKVVKVLMKEAGIEGFFTNHSLCRTCGTRLFQAGVERKLIKGVTGYQSDAINAYSVTSERQKQKLSEIFSKPPVSTVSVNPDNREECEGQNEENNVIVPKFKVNGSELSRCSCKSKVNLDEIVGGILKEASKNGYTVIRLEIEIKNE